MAKTTSGRQASKYRRSAGKPGRQELIKTPEGQFPLSKINFYIMGGAAAAIVLGFLLMTGAGSTENGFNPDIFSARRIIVGPTIAFLGFVAMAVGIIWLPRRKKNDAAKSRENEPQEGGEA